MKTRILIFCIIVLAFCGWLLLHRATEQSKNDLHQAQAALTNQQSVQPSQSESAQNPNTPTPSPTLMAEMARQATPEAKNERRKQFMADWQKPIEFYGQVVDENTNPVEGATIQFRWSGFSDKVSTSTTESDVGGLFSLHGKNGRSLDVSVSKAGYYNSRKDKTGFLYSLGPDIYSPDPQNPVVFNLHKKGQGVELITSENGMQSDVSVRIPKDNTTVRVDFFQKQASATGQLQIRQNKPPWQGATNWSFNLSISDGGLVENQDEFQFAAPESGYQPTVEYDFTKGETNWTTHAIKQFYITFGQPREYGWLRIESDIAQETIFLTYAINPTGSRNLEPTN